MKARMSENYISRILWWAYSTLKKDTFVPAYLDVWATWNQNDKCLQNNLGLDTNRQMRFGRAIKIPTPLHRWYLSMSERSLLQRSHCHEAFFFILTLASHTGKQSRNNDFVEMSQRGFEWLVCSDLSVSAQPRSLTNFDLGDHISPRTEFVKLSLSKTFVGPHPF